MKDKRVLGETIRMLVRTLLIATAIALTGCAGVDFHTVERRTPLLKEDGVAIHLDSQLRLIFYNAKRYCAEPSPDALQAYAASLGSAGVLESRGQPPLLVGHE